MNKNFKWCSKETAKSNSYWDEQKTPKFGNIHSVFIAEEIKNVFSYYKI